MTEPKQKFVAYYRVSTNKQGERGLGMESQIIMVEDYVKRVNGEIINKHIEVVTGKKNDRKGVLSALAECKKTGAILAVAKLDRLARDVLFIAQLVKSKIPFVPVESPNIDKNYIYMKAVFAEMETDMISARTKAALSVKKSKGFKLGNPRLKEHNEERTKKSQQFIAEMSTIITELKLKGYNSQRKIAKELTRRKVKTPTGRETWQINQVTRVLEGLKTQTSSQSMEMTA